ncbi:hypothetical protein ABZS61_28660 [Streptomyces sp. NPDC005566]|uniref:hypothetical protein n=1 Tax=Streptomyces sp. NPDC005566 TaxID=3156886 RepID=UPI0033A45028
MSARPGVSDAPWRERVPENLGRDVTDEMAAYVERVPEAASCVATGSLIEGLGNGNSDIDLYVIQPSDGAATNPVAIGIRDSRYVDVEYLNLAALHKLADAFEAASADEVPAAFALRDFARYYRLAIAARLQVTDEGEALLDRFSTQRSSALFAPWSLTQAAVHLARATVARGLKDVPRAVVLTRRAAVWRATSRLAAEGEGYPHLKWATVKAARRFGADTPGYRSCLEGHDVTPATLDAVLAALREHIAPAAATGGDDVVWTLAEGVTTVADGDDLHLILGRRSIARVDGLRRVLVDHLAEGNSWSATVELTAEQLHVSPGDVRTTAAPLMRELADAGYVASAAQGGRR